MLAGLLSLSMALATASAAIQWHKCASELPFNSPKLGGVMVVAVKRQYHYDIRMQGRVGFLSAGILRRYTRQPRSPIICAKQAGMICHR